MKAISLWQPWATLYVMGVKPDETRHWPTNVRGDVAIHAAKRWTKEQAMLVCQTEFYDALDKLWPPGMSAMNFGRLVLPRGAIVGIVNITGCEKITDANKPPMPGLAFGDYTPGRYKWPGSNPRQFSNPIPWKGAQGFFDVPTSLIESELSLTPTQLYPGGNE